MCFSSIYLVKPKKVEGNAVLLVGAGLIIVATIAVIAGYTFKDYDSMQTMATDIYNEAPQQFRDRIQNVLTSTPAFVAGSSTILIDNYLIGVVKDIYQRRIATIQTQVTAFSRWWNAQFDMTFSTGTTNDFSLEGFSSGVTSGNTYNYSFYGHSCVGRSWSVTQAQADSFNSAAAAWVASKGAGYGYTPMSARAAFNAVESSAYYETDLGDFMPGAIVATTTATSMSIAFKFMYTNFSYTSIPLGAISFPSGYTPSFALGGTETLPADVTYGLEGVLRYPDDDNRLGTATYPYTEINVNSPSTADEIVNTRVIDVPYTSTGTATIPWGGTVSGIPLDGIISDTGEIVITEPATETVELQNNSINFDSYKGNWEMLIDKFPFCIPFDLANAIVALFKESKTPVIEVDLTGGGENVFLGAQKFELDFDIFDKLVKVIHWGILIGFNLSLILVTRKLIRG